MNAKIEWLESLKQGDEVAVYYHGGYGGGSHYKDVVVSTSPAWIVTEKHKYRRDNGRRTKLEKLQNCRIEEPWSEYEARQRRQKLVWEIKDKASKLTLDQLERIAAILDETTEVSQDGGI